MGVSERPRNEWEVGVRELVSVVWYEGTCVWGMRRLGRSGCEGFRKG